MTNVPKISGPEFGPASGGAAKQLVVLLHGWGADGNDLIGLAPVWARRLPDAVFVSPHAPYPCDMGMGRQWFGLDDRDPAAMVAGTRAAAAIIDGFLDDALTHHGLDESRTALVGFSQGTMMSLYVAPRRARACAGVLGYSGALIDGASLTAEIVSRPPMMLIHGEADEIVPCAALADAADRLAAVGIAVESHLRPGLGHGIDEQGMILGAGFLARVLAAATPVTG